MAMLLEEALEARQFLMAFVKVFKLQ